MKILIITELLAPYRVNWFNELGKMSDVTVLYTKDKETTRESNWLSSIAIKCKCKKLECKNFFSKEISVEVIKYLDKDYDIILLDGYGFFTQMLAIIYLKLKRKQFVMNIDGGLVKYNENKIVRMIKSFFIKSPSYYLSSSINTDEYLKFYGANINNIYHHNFTSLFKKDILDDVINEDDKKKIKEELNIKYEKIIISVGRFIQSKGFDILIKSASIIDRDVGIYIVGGNPTDEYLKLIKKYSLDNVHFISFKESEILKKYYMASDLFVLPTRSDVWGLVINEAMSCGLPIITTNKCIAGLELVEDYKNGFIIDVDDYINLSKKINYILSDKNIIENMSKFSISKIKEYTIENMANQHIKVFGEILKNY